jgi:hypothetical protein
LLSVTSQEAPTQQPSEVKIEVTSKKYSRNSLDNDSSSMYLFTDNAERTSRPNATSPNIIEGWYAEKYKDKTDKPLHYGSKSNPTSAVIRGKNNAYPISTMSAYGTNWTNENFDLFKDTIDDEIAQIKQDLPKFKTLKLGNFRIGQGGRFAKLPSQHQSYLDSKLLELGIDNSGNIPKVIKPTQQTSGVEQSENVLEAQASLPEVSEQKAEQLDLFEAELQDRYPIITEFYNSIFALGFVNEEILQNKTSLKENNISSLEDMVSAFETNSFESEESFVENIKKCILGK